MSTETHRQLANDIWSICNLLRGPYKRNEYRKVILPLTVLRRFDCLLAPTKTKALETFNQYKGKPESIIRSVMQSATGYPFYNLSKLELAPSQKGRNSLLDDPSNLAPNLNSYINGYSPNIRAIFDHFKFGEQISKMVEKNLLFQVIQKFVSFDLSFAGLSADQAGMQMGYVFEELIRIGAEQSNEEAGEHFTPREVIKLMVNLLLSPEQDLRRSHVVKTIYDPACGTGGMLSVAEKYIRDLNSEAKPHLYGQDWNDEAWAVCRSDMLIKGEDADNIALGDTFTKDAHARDEQGQKRSFDYMLANPPFGVEWKQQQRYIEHERDNLGYQGRFGAGTPRINDGALLFLQHMIDKMRPASEGGSRIGIVFNGYRLQRVSSGPIELKVGEPEAVYGPSDVGTGKAKEEKAPLSEIIQVLNERFGTAFTDEDRLFFDQIKARATSNSQVIQTAMANPLDKFQLGVRKLIEDLMIQRMAENDKIVTRYMDDGEFQRIAFPVLAKEIFESIHSNNGNQR